MGGCTSGWNGYPQTEQSFRLPSGTKCGTGVALLANPEGPYFLWPRGHGRWRPGPFYADRINRTAFWIPHPDSTPLAQPFKGCVFSHRFASGIPCETLRTPIPIGDLPFSIYKVNSVKQAIQQLRVERRSVVVARRT